MANHQRRRNDLTTDVDTRRAIRELKNGARGRRLTTDEKLMALDRLMVHIEARAKEDGYTLTDGEPLK